MRRSDIAELLVLAALWGASFLFMRIAAPAFGPVALAALRVVGAAAVLLPLLVWRGEWAALRRHWRPIAVVGAVNSALPFLLYSHAALSITAGLSSIFNAASPLFVALIGFAWLRDRVDRTRAGGLAIGLFGVAWLVADQAGLRPGADTGAAAGAAAACIGAALCYGLGANLAKRFLAGVPPVAVAGGSQLAAALLLAGPAVATWPATPPGAAAWGTAAGLAVLCTGAAYVLYFRLIRNTGPGNAIVVTFLIPLFAVAWGWLFLDEGVTPTMAGSGAVILLGTGLATGLLGRRSPAVDTTPAPPAPPRGTAPRDRRRARQHAHPTAAARGRACRR